MTTWIRPRPSCCVNPRCGEMLVEHGFALCPSCQLAGRWGALIAFLLMALLKLAGLL